MRKLLFFHRHEATLPALFAYLAFNDGHGDFEVLVVERMGDDLREERHTIKDFLLDSEPEVARSLLTAIDSVLSTEVLPSLRVVGENG